LIIGIGNREEHGWNNTRLVEATAGCKTETRVNIVYLSPQVLRHSKCGEKREASKAGHPEDRQLNGATKRDIKM
jgi:hypothetical protein